jgi:transcription antitermination factor NusG
MGWHVVYVKPRTEKKMAEHCAAHGLEHYLPLRRETKIYQRRKVTVDKPVFPGYVFVVFDAESRVTVLKANPFVRVLETADEARLVHELEQVRLALAVDPALGTDAALRHGTPVRITAGPFQGIEGIVESMQNPAKVRLNVEMIGRAVVVDVGREYVEAVRA